MMLLAINKHFISTWKSVHHFVNKFMPKIQKPLIVEMIKIFDKYQTDQFRICNVDVRGPSFVVL